MEAFATVTDLEARWRILSEEEKTKANTLLSDASVHLQTLISRKYGENYTPSELMSENLKIITCNIVMRSMNVKQGFFGCTEISTTAGPYSQTFTPINSSGDMRLTAEELKLLGLSSASAGFVFPYCATEEEEQEVEQ